MLQRPQFLNKTVIEKAFEAGDKETVIEAYLDILDYDRELKGADVSFFIKVLESMSYEDAVDHVLFGHLNEQMKDRGFHNESQFYSTIYYLHAKGGLASADILKSFALDKLPNSELFKSEFMEQVYPPEDAESENPLNLDAFVLE